METINLGRVAFVYKGDYSAVTTYNKMDVVFDGESSFVSQIDNNVGNPLVNGLNWKYLSRGNNLELQEAKQDIATLETDLNGIKNYADNKWIYNQTGGIQDKDGYAVSNMFDVDLRIGDTIEWKYGNVNASVLFYAATYKNGVFNRVFWSTEKSINGVYSRVIDKDADSVQITYVMSNDVQPFFKKNGNLVWQKVEDGNITNIIKDIDEIKSEIPLKLDLAKNTTYTEEQKQNARNNIDVVSINDLERGKSYATNYWVNGAGNIVESNNGYIVNGKPYTENGVIVNDLLIPCVGGNTVRWIFGNMTDYQITNVRYPYLQFLQSDKRTKAVSGQSNWGPLNGSGTERIITAPSDSAYIVASFVESSDINTELYINNERVWYRYEDGPIYSISNDVVKLSEKLDSRVPVYDFSDVLPNLGAFDKINEQVHTILKFNHASINGKSNVFQFVHISDTHSTDFGFAEELVDNIDTCKFLAHTGDIAQDKFSDPITSYASITNSMTKPCFCTVGNHDVVGSTNEYAVYEKFIQPFKEHNGITTEHTYYSKDYTTEKIKCIFLDIYNAVVDRRTQTQLLMYPVVDSAQINWFVSELINASTNNYQVIVFAHQANGDIDRRTAKIKEYMIESCKSAEVFAKILDAWMESGSVSFDHNSQSYAFDFSSNANGIFIGWFVGHEHNTNAGYLLNHSNQFCFSATRPLGYSTYDGSYRENIPMVLNYITIRPDMRQMSIMRIGTDESVMGTVYETINIQY